MVDFLIGAIINSILVLRALFFDILNTKQSTTCNTIEVVSLLCTFMYFSSLDVTSTKEATLRIKSIDTDCCSFPQIVSPDTKLEQERIYVALSNCCVHLHRWLFTLINTQEHLDTSKHS
jgi:hypothetical protein